MKPMTQKEKAELFLKLHHDKEILVILNSWDPGSSKLIEASGFKAIGTTSMGVSASLGYPDCEAIQFTEMLQAIKRISDNVTLPVTVDIEGGFGNTPKDIAANIKQVIETGVVGINLEDSAKLDPELLDEAEFSERISAVRKLADSLGIHLVINARTDAFLTSSGTPESCLTESIKRGKRYIEAGADCIFVPNVTDVKSISSLVKEIAAPVNILANPTNGVALPPSLKELENLGVARVSFGSSVMKSTLTLIKRIADETLQSGTYQTLFDATTPIEETRDAYKMATDNPVN
jgi:2-methylisocitrate lyase-like PEP mutase family enzyme